MPAFQRVSSAEVDDPRALIKKSSLEEKEVADLPDFIRFEPK